MTFCSKKNIIVLQKASITEEKKAFLKKKQRGFLEENMILYHKLSNDFIVEKSIFIRNERDFTSKTRFSGEKYC